MKTVLAESVFQRRGHQRREDEKGNSHTRQEYNPLSKSFDNLIPSSSHFMLFPVFGCKKKEMMRQTLEMNPHLHNNIHTKISTVFL